MRNRLLLSVGLLFFAVSARADIGSVITFPAGSNGDVQFNKNKNFGADSGNLTYSTSTKRLSVPGLVFSTMTVNGQTYVFPQSQTGGAFLRTDGAGNLTWATPTDVSVSTGTNLTILDGEDVISFPTSGIQFNEVQFLVSLTGGTTAAVSLDPSIVSLLGPTIDLGTEVVGSLPASLIAAGNLGSSVVASSIAVNAVQDSSIVGVSGSKVSGNIVGNAAGITGTVNVSQVVGAVTVYAATATASFPYGQSASTMSISNSSSVNYGLVITSTGTKSALRVVGRGLPDSAYQSLDGGIVNIQVSENTFPAPALVLVSSNTDAQLGGGILEIWQESVNHNDPHLWIHAKDHQSAGNMRIDSGAPNFEIVNTSTDNVHGFGKWEPFAAAYQSARMQVASSRCYDNSGFNNLAYWEPMSKGGGLYLQPFDSTGCEAAAGVGTSSVTIPIAWTTLNNHTVGLRGPYNTTASWNFTLPSTFNNGGQVLAQQVGNGARNWEFTTGGSAGQVLTFVSTSAVPSWTTVSGSAGSTVYAATATASFPFGFTGSTTTMGSITSTALGTNPWVTMNSSGTSSALTINGYGQPAGVVQQKIGLVNINQIADGGASAALVIVDSITETQTGEGLLEIYEEATGHNDPLIWVKNKSSNSAPIMRMDDPQPDFELVNTSTDNTHGMGKWEPFASPNLGTQLQVNSRAYDNSTFERVAEWRMRQKGTALALYPTILAENGNPTATNTAQLIWISTNSSREWGMRGPQNPAASFYITWPSRLPDVGSLLYMTEAAGERKMGWTADGTENQVLKFHVGSAPTWGDIPAGGSSYSMQYKDASGGLAGSGFFLDIHQQALLVGTTTGAEGTIALQEAAANGSSYVALKASASLAGSTTWTLPDADGSAGDLLGTTGSAGGHTLTWVTPSGTPGGGSRAVQYKSGTSFGGSGKISITSNDDLTIATTGQIQLFQADNAHYVGFVAPTSGLGGSTVWKLPVTGGTTGQVLTTGGTGDSNQLFWNTPSASSGGGGDSFGSHSATMTVTANYGIVSTTVTVTTITVQGQIAFSDRTSIMKTPAGTSFLSIPDVQTTYLGEGAGSPTAAGTFNTCFGASCMSGVNSGSFNTGLGNSVMVGTLTGDQNNCIGYAACNAMTSGSYNNAMGGSAMLNTTTGGSNVGVGLAACRDCNGSLNTALGTQASEFLASGSNNTEIGYLAGVGTTTVTNSNVAGSNNVYIGVKTGQSVSSSTAISNSIAIGNSALVAASNQAQIGGRIGTGSEVRLTVTSATIQGSAFQVGDQFDVTTTSATISGQARVAGNLTVVGNITTSGNDVLLGAASILDFYNAAGNRAATMQNDGATGLQKIRMVAADGTNITYNVTAGSITTAGNAKLNGGLSLTPNLVNTNYTALASDTVILASATPTGITVTLPAATSAGQVLTITKVSMSTYPVTIMAATGDLIGGTTGAVILNAYGQSASIQGTGANLWVPFGGQGIQQTPNFVGPGMNQAGTASSINTSSMTACMSFNTQVPVIVDSITVHVAVVGTGNVDVGIYSASGARLASNGGAGSAATLQAGRSHVKLSSPVTLAPGNYWMCMVNSDVTTTYTSTTITGTVYPDMQDCTGVNYPLPSTLSLGSCTGARLSRYGMMGHVVGGAY